MSPVPRAVVEAFYHALSVRDMAALANFLDDDVVWTISGPVDILPFCARRQVSGHEVVGTRQPDLVVPPSLRRNDHACGWRSPLSDRQAHRNKACKRWAISYRIAHFIQFRDEKVIDYVSIIDSFDASNNCWATILMRMTAIGSRATSSRCSRG
jgi:hypothetical protein